MTPIPPPGPERDAMVAKVLGCKTWVHVVADRCSTTAALAEVTLVVYQWVRLLETASAWETAGATRTPPRSGTPPAAPSSRPPRPGREREYS